MIGALLALFKRSLREDCRAKTNYLARAGLLCVILLFLVFTHETMRMGAPGLEFFGTVIYINCIFIIIGGVSHFASSITEEKEEMTLGLLRMTNLNPLSILLGKSAGRVLNAILLLAVQFPFTLLAVSMGGVSIQQVVAAYCTLAGFVVLIGGVAVFFSVISRRTSLAASFTMFFFLLFFFGPLLAEAWTSGMKGAGWMTAHHPVLDWLLTSAQNASPFMQLYKILQTGFSDPPVGYQVMVDTAAGFLFFLLAWLGFNRFCRQDTEAAPGRITFFRKIPQFRRLNAGRAWRAALFWKDFNFMSGGKIGMLVRFTLLTAFAGYLFVEFIFRTQNTNFAGEWSQFGGMLAAFMGLILALELSIGAARIFRQEIAWQTLSSIALLPVSTRTLIYRKAMGHLFSAIPTIFYFGVGLLLFMANANLGSDAGDFVFFIILMFLEGILLIHLIAYLSLVLKRAAFPLGIGIMFIGNMVTTMVLGFMFSGGGGPSGPGAIFFLMCVGSFGLTVVFHVITGARLRRAAAEE